MAQPGLAVPFKEDEKMRRVGAARATIKPVIVAACRNLGGDQAAGSRDGIRRSQVVGGA